MLFLFAFIFSFLLSYHYRSRFHISPESIHCSFFLDRCYSPGYSITYHVFRLQYICLLSHRDITESCHLQDISSRLISIAPAWKTSIHTLYFSSVGDNISCFRSLSYFSPMTPVLFKQRNIDNTTRHKMQVFMSSPKHSRRINISSRQVRQYHP